MMLTYLGITTGLILALVIVAAILNDIAVQIRLLRERLDVTNITLLNLSVSLQAILHRIREGE